MDILSQKKKSTSEHAKSKGCDFDGDQNTLSQINFT